MKGEYYDKAKNDPCVGRVFLDRRVRRSNLVLGASFKSKTHGAVSPAGSLQGLTDEEKANAIEKWRADRQQQEKEIDRERINRMATEAWKRLLGADEQQWKIVEPKIDEVQVLGPRSGGNWPRY